MKIYTSIFLVFFSLAFSQFARSAESASFNCSLAKLALEKVICSNPELGKRDIVLNKLFQKTKKRMDGEVLKAFVSAQKEWIAERNHLCADKNSHCIAELYDERIFGLNALLARTSDSNPDIDLANPAVLQGQWVVQNMTAQKIDDSRSPTSISLPPVGSTVEAKLGQICVQSKLKNGCNEFGLAIKNESVSEFNQSRHLSNINKTGAVMLSYFSGRADFELIPLVDGSLIAVYLACDPQGNSCVERFQLWKADPANAKITYSKIFN